VTDHDTTGITENRELLLRDLFPNVVIMLYIIHADGDDAGVELVEVGLSPRELAQLHHAEGSPVAAVEDQENAVAEMIGQVEGLAGLVGEREVGGELAGGRGDLWFGQAELIENETSTEQGQDQDCDEDTEAAVKSIYFANGPGAAPSIHPIQF